MMEVVVVGGGIAGASVALELVRRGVAVNVVDAERAGGAATGASAGMLAPQYESAGHTPLFQLTVESRERWPAFAERIEALSGRALDLRHDGMLVANLSAEEEAGAEEDVRWQRAAGQRAEVIDPSAARARQRRLSQGALSYLWLPDEGQADSQALALALPEALGATPARVLEGQRVVALLENNGHVTGVRLEDGRTLSADAVILAAGAWSGTIQGLPRTLPLRPVRGHMLRFPAGAARLTPLLATHQGRYLVPRADGSILAGSTMDDVGFDRSLSEDGMAAVHRSAGRLLPDLADAEPVERWADLRPITDDGFPILGPEPRLEGLFHATGYGRNGILLGPLAGEIVADLVVTGTSTHDLTPFAPDRLDP
ncbi:MAG: glycine oxidase ThiO [Gemmatimonadota bacterium]